MMKSCSFSTSVCLLLTFIFSNLYNEIGTHIQDDSRYIDWSDFIDTMKKNTPKVIENIAKKILNVHPTREAFQLFGVLTKEECAFLIEQTEAIGYQTLKSYNGKYRSNTRRIILYDNLRDIIWERVKGFITTTIEDKYLQSNWEAYNLNPQFRFCRYEPGQHFSPHYDSHFEISSTNRSFYTFMIYLNEVKDGGATHFLSDSSNPPRGRILEKLQPEPGMLLIFQHNIYHEGEELNKGVKYLMRSDIMYELVKIDDEKKKYESDKRLKAMDLINQAERFEFEGDYENAIKCYKEAYKLCPELENPSSNDLIKDHLYMDTQI